MIILNLPAGNRAHEIPDMVLTWIEEFQNYIENISDIFGNELLDVEDILSLDTINSLSESLQVGIEHAFDGFVKWMSVWIHLPLSICRLGGNRGPEYARAFLQVFEFQSESNCPTIYEKIYIEHLQQDLINQNQNTLAYLKHYQIIIFMINLINSQILMQQLEGMFNRYDIKTHPNMDAELQQDRIQISGLNSGIENITQEKLSTYSKRIKKFY
ncbi:hypothetical protein C2G38_2160853 [Gigaspora rosea]|uniref:Uncharacterized protein n=1 Tax=Gigaspora rosea TaxID=44941 RepID=A0A397W4Y3_9GLOM|nr:hypothetical protein C2G38_2160853 [Gigaspora rosea]